MRIRFTHNGRISGGQVFVIDDEGKEIDISSCVHAVEIQSIGLDLPKLILEVVSNKLDIDVIGDLLFAEDITEGK